MQHHVMLSPSARHPHTTRGFVRGERPPGKFDEESTSLVHALVPSEGHPDTAPSKGTQHAEITDTNDTNVAPTSTDHSTYSKPGRDQANSYSEQDGNRVRKE